MGEPLFISQENLEAWIEAGEAAFDDDVVTFAAERRSYRVAPAVRVRSLIDGTDAHGLVGRVVTLAMLAELGAEHYAGSVIIGDTGYECEEGYAATGGDAARPQPRGEVVLDPAPARPAAPAATEPKSDAELLAEYLLEKL